MSNTPTTENTIDTLSRQLLLAFLIRVFRTLHPAGPRLAMNWHIKAMCRLLERVDAGEFLRLIMEVPPRHLKSIATSVAFTAWLLGRNPGLKIIVASYSSELAEKHARDFRMIVNSAWYKALFPRTVIRSDTANEIVTAAGGGRRAVSLGGTVTGLGADIIIIDDLMKAADSSSDAETRRVHDFYTQTLLSRLNSQVAGKIIVIQQRLANMISWAGSKNMPILKSTAFPPLPRRMNALISDTARRTTGNVVRFYSPHFCRWRS